MHPYVKEIQTLYEKNANPSQAAPMKKYMRDQFDYLGIKTPQAKALQKEFYAAHELPEISELDVVVRDLWALPQREYKYFAMGLMDKFQKKLPAGFIETVEHLIVTESWWDTVDLIATHQVGTLFRRYPQVKEK